MLRERATSSIDSIADPRAAASLHPRDGLCSNIQQKDVLKDACAAGLGRGHFAM